MIDLTAALKPIESLVPELFPLGYVSFLGAREGVGKTTLLTALAWQMTRPAGQGTFAGRSVKAGNVIYLNTDAADGQSRSVRYWLEQHRAAFPDGDMSKVIVLETEGLGLQMAEMQELLNLAEMKAVACIIIDSFMGTFPGLDGNKLKDALSAMLELRGFAARTGAAVIVTDHLPKKAPGEREGDRGIMGSTGKTAQARAVHLLTRVPPKEVDGRDVLRWEVRKASFARSGYAFGLEVERELDDDGKGVSVHLTPYELPAEDSEPDTRGTRAMAAVVAHLEASAGATVPHTDLVALAVERGNLQDRAARDAVTRALGQIWERLEAVKLPGRGGRKAYRLKDTSDLERDTATNGIQSVQDSLLFVAPLDCHTSPTATVPAEFEEEELAW